MIHNSAYSVILPFGKYKGMSLGQIYNTNKGYLEWLSGTKGDWAIAAARTLLGEEVTITTIAPIEQPTTVIIEQSKESKKKFLVRFPYNEVVKDNLKSTVDSLWWSEKEKGWQFSPAQVVRLVNFFGGPSKCTVDVDVRERFIAEKKRTRILKEVREKLDSDVDAPTILPLRGYQRVALEFSREAGGNIFLCDPVGLGKTPAAIGVCLINGGISLIICEKNLKLQWEQQLKKFVGKKVTICHWSADGPQGKLNAQFHIVHYNVVDRFVKDFNKLKITTIICDEATDFIANYRSVRTKAIMGNWNERRIYPGIKTKYIWLLSGTPMKNKLRELYTLLSFLDKERFSNPSHFIQRYENYGVPTNLEELNERINELMLRRPKSIRPGEKLPERNELLVEMTPEETEEYNSLMRDLFGKWAETRPNAATITPLRKFLFKIKWSRLIQMIDQLLVSDRPVLVFSIQQDHAEEIAAQYKNVGAYIHGGIISEEKREQVKQDLISGKLKVGSYTLGTGARGMDGLQMTISDTIFVERSWLPSDHEQGEGRTARDGQKTVPQMWYMTVVDTWEEILRDLLIEKQNIFDRAIDGKTVDEIKAKKGMNTSIFNDFVQRLSRQTGNKFFDFDEE